jgi:uncharacterized protein YihD (DUF1040 family)
MTLFTARKMIRPEKYQYNWKPRYNSKEDLKLVQNLDKLQKKSGIKKSELLRRALINFVKYHKTFPLPEDKK